MYSFCYITCGSLQIFFLLDFLKCDLQINFTVLVIHSLGIYWASVRHIWALKMHANLDAGN